VNAYSGELISTEVELDGLGVLGSKNVDVFVSLRVLAHQSTLQTTHRIRLAVHQNLSKMDAHRD
jgi:hypothetical protein